MDSDLQAVPDLAARWESAQNGRSWTFWIAAGAKDHAGRHIQVEDLRDCFESYRIGKPLSTVGKTFAQWQSTDLVQTPKGAEKGLRFTFGVADPYLPKNASALRFFRTGENQPPCSEPVTGEAMIGSGAYRNSRNDLHPETHLELDPVDEGYPPLRFDFVREEGTRTLKMVRGEADLALNTLSLSKTRWIHQRYPDRFDLWQRHGTTVSYLAFNLRDPILSKRDVREAIARSIDREAIVSHKMFGFGEVAGSLLSAKLPEASPQELRYDPVQAEVLLERAGYPRGKDGIRLRLKYKTTPVREGYEQAILFREMLAKVGIELSLEVIEPAVFQSTVKQGNYQIHASRWVGISDGAILFRTLHSKEQNNRWGYADAEMDQWLMHAMSQSEPGERAKAFARVQRKAWEDLPYLPLYFWNVGLVLRRDLASTPFGAPQGSQENLSLSGGFDALVRQFRR